MASKTRLVLAGCKAFKAALILDNDPAGRGDGDQRVLLRPRVSSISAVRPGTAIARIERPTISDAL